MSGAQGYYFTMCGTPFVYQENPQQLGLHGVVIFQGFSQGLQYDNLHPNQAPR